MDCDDSCYFVDYINSYVADFVQDSLLEDKLDDILEEEPPREIKPKREHEGSTMGPPPRKKWWKRVESKKKKQSLSPRTDKTPVSTFDFGKKDFISFLSMHITGYDSSSMEGEKLHPFVPS